jgi:hypothetical protein
MGIDTWVYLDTNIIISLTEAFDGHWRPPPRPLNRTDQHRLSAVRIFLYGSPARWSRWYLTTSSEARLELRRVQSLMWLDVMFPEVDLTADRFEPGVLTAEATRYRTAGAKEADAAHLAHASIRPWIQRFITDDDQLRSAARRAGLPDNLEISSSVEAVEALQIANGERPPIAPHPTSPLADECWWIPGSEYS